jgi:hypothetical protein
MIVSQRIILDYKHDCVLVMDNERVVESYALESLRKHLWDNWTDLVFQYKIKTILKPESFYLNSNQLVYQACLDLFNAGEPIDLLTVVQALKKSANLA